MKKTYSYLLSVAVLFAAQEMAWAEETHSGDHMNLMEQADTNKDGKVSFDEFKAFHDAKMQEMFKKLDTNGDGFVDKDEARNRRESIREKLNERMQKHRAQ